MNDERLGRHDEREASVGDVQRVAVLVKAVAFEEFVESTKVAVRERERERARMMATIPREASVILAKQQEGLEDPAVLYNVGLRGREPSTILDGFVALAASVHV